MPEQLGYLWARVKAGEPIQIHSDTLGESVWWVRDDEIASALQQQGITEVCYTIAELRELAGQPAEFLKDVHQRKQAAPAQPEPAAPSGGTLLPQQGIAVCCGDCRCFAPDRIGDGSGIGRCTAGVTPRPQIDPPLYPKAPRRCDSFQARGNTDDY